MRETLKALLWTHSVVLWFPATTPYIFASTPVYAYFCTIIYTVHVHTLYFTLNLALTLKFSTVCIRTYTEPRPDVMGYVIRDIFLLLSIFDFSKPHKYRTHTNVTCTHVHKKLYML